MSALSIRTLAHEAPFNDHHSADPLGNPVWASLTGHHACHAIREAKAARYPSTMLPIFAVADASVEAAEDLANLAAPGEPVFLAGCLPPLNSGWQIQQQKTILQMTLTRTADVDHPTFDGEVHTLGPHDAAEMLALARRVLPRFFRPRTPETGGYLGIRQQGQLVAMAGERLSFEGHREISSVCTDPAFIGRGFAGRLVAALLRRQLDAGLQPWLCVDPENRRARGLYERLGFSVRAMLPVLSAIRRPSA